MTTQGKNQKIFDALADLECMLYYHPEKTAAIVEVHQLVNKALLQFAKETGTHN